jgi:hypothetical protein
MRAQTSHLDADVLAEFRAGLIAGRRKRQIAAHLAGCARCTAVAGQLADLSALLAAIPAPAMPDSVAHRLDTVLAAEVARHDSAERAVVHRSRHRAPASRLPRWPSQRLMTMRVLAPTAAVAVILAAGGYGLSLIGGGSQPAPSSAAAPAEAPAASAVPSPARVSYEAGNTTSRAFNSEAGRAAVGITPSRTDYLRVTLRSQLEGALRAPAGPGRAQPAAQTPDAQAPSAQLQACLQRLTSGIRPGVLTLVQSAHFAGRPALVIVASSGGGYVAWVVAPGWAGPGCSATSAGVLATTTLPGIPTP